MLVKNNLSISFPILGERFLYKNLSNLFIKFYPLPLQGIVLSIIFLKVTSNKSPNIPIINMVIQITSYWKYFLATFSTNPIPVVTAKNYAATRVPQHIPTATLIPVSISGKELGKITYLKICFFEAPKE